jgi:nucleotide-binding universal stress UspA family protein
MFTRLLVGLDGSPLGDAALEQAVVLGRRFHSMVIVAVVAEGDGRELADAAMLLERGRFRVEAAGVAVEAVQREGSADEVLAELAKEKDVDAALVGRRGVITERAGPAVVGRTVSSLIRIAERTVIVCGGVASPMRNLAVAFDGRNRRALDLAGRFASVADSTVHVIHAYRDRAEGTGVIGLAEAELSRLGVQFQTHLEEGPAGEVIARVVRAIRADALFAGAHVPRGPGERRTSVASHTEDILLHTDLPVAIQP